MENKMFNKTAQGVLEINDMLYCLQSKVIPNAEVITTNPYDAAHPYERIVISSFAYGVPVKLNSLLGLPVSFKWRRKTNKEHFIYIHAEINLDWGIKTKRALRMMIKGSPSSIHFPNYTFKFSIPKEDCIVTQKLYSPGQKPYDEYFIVLLGDVLSFNMSLNLSSSSISRLITPSNSFNGNDFNRGSFASEGPCFHGHGGQPGFTHPMAIPDSMFMRPFAEGRR